MKTLMRMVAGLLVVLSIGLIGCGSKEKMGDGKMMDGGKMDGGKMMMDGKKEEKKM